MWLGADQFRKCIGFRLLADGEAVENHNAPENNVYSNQEYVQEAVLTYTYETITVPATTVDVSYTVHADGKIHVLVHYHGKEDCRNCRYLECGLYADKGSRILLRRSVRRNISGQNGGRNLWKI